MNYRGARSIVGFVIALNMLLLPVAPAFAQLGGTIDTSGTTAPAPTPAPVVETVAQPSEPTPIVITTPIPETSPTPPVTATMATETTLSTPVAPLIAPIIAPPADTTPSVITGVSSLSLEPHTATIIWTTDELATSRLEYGTTPNYGSTVTLAVTASLAHDATMLNLTPNTIYYYCIHATDLAGNTSSSCGHSVTTAATEVVIDTVPPTISIETVSLITTNSASVTWATDKLATGYVEYGTTDAYGSQTPFETDLTLSHTAPVTGLSPNTIYHYRIHSRDASGNTVATVDNTFTTSTTGAVVSEPTTTASESPVSIPSITVTVPEATITVSVGSVTVTTPTLIMSSIAADSVSQTGATITWTTDLPSTSNVTYGDTGQFDLTVGSTTLTTAHSVTLTGLAPDTTYQFRVASAPLGVSAVEIVSHMHDFTTLARPIVLNPPANILSVSSPNVTSTSATVSFTTDEITHGSVEYGLTTSYGESASSSSVQTSHTLALSALLPGTTYHFRVKAIDMADNITYSIDHTLITSGSAAGIETRMAQTVSSTISEAPASADNHSPSSVGVAAPAIVTVAPVDGEVVFIVNPQPTIGDNTVIVVRSDGTYPTSPTDGQVVYDGASSTFTDTNLTNGSTYDYTVYTRRSGGGYSNPVHIAATPKAGIEQISLDQNPVLEPAIATHHFVADISIGVKSDEVEHLQQILNTESIHPTGLTTGYFGPLTLASLKRFQTKYNLSQTGFVDAPTRKVLNSLSQGLVLLGAPTALRDLTTDLKQGDTGQSVADLQEFLSYEGSYVEGDITSYYGVLTKESVADFQRKFGVTPVSGYVGPKTRHTILTVLGQ